MKFGHAIRIVTLAVVLFAVNAAYAQKTAKRNTYTKSTENNEIVWKKQVYRMVDLNHKDDANSDRLRDVNEDKTLIEMLANEIKDGSVSAYSNSEMRILNKLNEKEIKKLFGPKPDTALVQDANGRWTTDITQKAFDYDRVHKYKILEEWSCRPAGGATQIQILAICPIQDIVSHDGVVRGALPLFWVRFENVVNVLNAYQQYQPNNTIMSHIWDDYFSSDMKPAPQR